MKLAPKQQHIITDWLMVWSKYLTFERSFEPSRLVYYKRGDIVHVHLGYNTGCEQGGTHYAVVVENNNSKTNGGIVIIPISSLEKGKSINNLHHSEVYLGKIIPDSDRESYAMPMQIRCISKLRIIKPRLKDDKHIKLKGQQMDLLDEKVKELFTKSLDKKEK